MHSDNNFYENILLQLLFLLRSIFLLHAYCHFQNHAFVF